MRTLVKFFASSTKILARFFSGVLPGLIRLIILATCILWKHCKCLSSSYKYRSTINKKTSRFTYSRKRAKLHEIECSICRSEFAEGEEGRELVDCRHVFHGACLEKWLQGYAATCPLCRRWVVPEVIVGEYRRMRMEHEKDGVFEKELALILLNALHGGNCASGVSSGQDFIHLWRAFA